MRKRLYIIIFAVFVLLVIIRFVVIDRQRDVPSVTELIYDVNVIYEEKDYSERQLTVLREKEEYVLSDNFPSKPAISPDRKRLCYIAPREWEMIGRVYAYCIKENKDFVIIDEDNIPSQYTPKVISWLDDRYLLVIIGYGYGTVSVGGDLYVYDFQTGDFSMCMQAGDRKEIKDVRVNNDEVELTIAVFDEKYMNYEKERKYITYDDIVGR